MRRSRTLLTFAALASTMMVSAQQQSLQPARTDIVVTYTTERALRTSSGQSFWKQGGSVSYGTNLWRGFGPATDLSVGHAGSIGSSGASLTTTALTFGPRYRWHPKSKCSSFGEALFGFVHGSNSAFPTATGTNYRATSFSMLIDGGLDIRLDHHIDVRALQLGWVHSTLPNGADNVQNNFRLSFGAGIHF
ncbi:MAG: hypothetical protein JF584_05755 [Acidobacteria bacterium]|nr:hypothetical protein [Acidobacteriota bacterium]